MGPEERRDETEASQSNLPLLFLLRWGRMRRPNDAKRPPTLVQAQVWTVGARTAGPTFHTVHVLIGRHVQACLESGMVEEAVVCATGDRCERVAFRDDPQWPS
jgi:hypothetical protein